MQREDDHNVSGLSVTSMPVRGKLLLLLQSDGDPVSDSRFPSALDESDDPECSDLASPAHNRSFYLTV